MTLRWNANRTELTARMRAERQEGEAKAYCKCHQNEKGLLLLFHFICWYNLLPIPKVLHSLTNVIASQIFYPLASMESPLNKFTIVGKAFSSSQEGSTS